jgi:ribosomal protein S18 acetylase RimI-like enzyme
MSGTGKSSALAELGRRGYRVVDTDDPGWREYRAYAEPADEVHRGEWLWVEEKITALLDSDSGRSLFVQGCVRNQSKFYDRFDAVVLLSAPADVILDRIARRTTNSYGKSPVERAMILDDLARIEPLLRDTCTHELDASRPLDEVVADLIAIGGAAREVRIRRGVAGDLAGIGEIVERAYGPYVERLGRRPAPMDDDYTAKLSSAEVYVAEVSAAEGAERLGGVLVLVPHDDHLLVETVAVDPDCQGAGIGRALLAQAERVASDHRLRELRLYTNALMTENLAYYRRLGYLEVERREEAGFDRVFFVKPLD